MTDAFDFDVLVIGAGPGGYVAAIRAAQLGLRTACADSRDSLGGTCLNVGCIPSKALLHASEKAEEVRSGALAAIGIHVGETRIDLDAMHAARRDAVSGLTKGIAGLFKRSGVEWLKGHAAFLGPDRVDVAGRSVRARSIIIATGSKPAALAGVPLDGEIIVDSTGALEFGSVPEHLAVIGGGVIGLELGSVWRRLGARVTVIEYQDTLLPGMDADISKEAARIFRAQGMTLLLGSKVTGAKTANGHATLSIEPVAGGETATIDCDRVLVATGRRPNTDGLALDRAGLSLDSAGCIAVDAGFQTAVPGIYAIGDVTPGPMLAHRAEDDGIALAELLASGTPPTHPAAIPSVVYTSPEIASVGLTEADARARGPVRVSRFPMLANSRARTNHESDGFVKLIADADTGTVLGAHIVASLGGTMIAQAAQAIEMGAHVDDIAYCCHAHPTHSEALKEAAMGIFGKPVHL